MRTVVVGNRKLARQLLRHTLEEGWDVVGVIAPEGELASTQANYEPFDELVTSADCELHEASDINNRTTSAWLRRIRPDVCLSGGWSQVIDEGVLAIPDRGFLGLHSSRLPEGRGGAPVNWSLIGGAEEVWISLFYYAPGVDTGDVVARGSVPVEPRDDVETVFDRLATRACQLVSSVRSQLEEDTVSAEAQSLENATYRPRRQPQDGLIDWHRDPRAQFDWVRAQTTPYPGAYTFFEGERLTVWRGEPSDAAIAGAKRGEVIAIVDGHGVDVRTGDGAFRLLRIQPDDRPPSWADEYARDIGLEPGDRLGHEFAPDDWRYTGIRGAGSPTSFDTNLTLGETGRIELVTMAGAPTDLAVRATMDGEVVFENSTPVAGDYREQIEYSPGEPGTHTLTVEYEINGEPVDARHLKVFVHG